MDPIGDAVLSTHLHALFHSFFGTRGNASGEYEMKIRKSFHHAGQRAADGELIFCRVGGEIRDHRSERRVGWQSELRFYRFARRLESFRIGTVIDDVKVVALRYSHLVLQISE